MTIVDHQTDRVSAFAAALFAYFGLHSSWKLIPAICFAGVGFLYLRGAAGSYVRRPGPAPTTKK